MYDSHCHLSPHATKCVFEDAVVPIVESTAISMNIMATNHIDHYLICNILSNPNVKPNVKCSIGIHPWWSHLYSFDMKLIDNESGLNESEIKRKHYEKVLESTKFSTKLEFDRLIKILPIPFSIYKWMEEFEGLLTKYDFSRLNVGEIGLDKLFRVPDCGFLGSSDSSPKLSTYKVNLEHQYKILELQLELASRFKRWVSVHNVKCSGKIMQAIKRYPKLPVVLHSYSGSVEFARELQRIGNVWFGISQVINLNSQTFLNDKTKVLIETINDKVLLETDLGIDVMKDEEHLNKLEMLTSIASEVNSSVEYNWETFWASISNTRG